jgi:hypothetical protein
VTRRRAVVEPRLVPKAERWTIAAPLPIILETAVDRFDGVKKYYGF